MDETTGTDVTTTSIGATDSTGYDYSQRVVPPGDVYGAADGEGVPGGLTGVEGGDQLSSEMAGMLALQTQTQSILLRYNTESNLANAAHSNRKSISDKLGQS